MIFYAPLTEADIRAAVKVESVALAVPAVCRVAQDSARAVLASDLDDATIRRAQRDITDAIDRALGLATVSADMSVVASGVLNWGIERVK